jgi:hypothetical protein
MHVEEMLMIGSLATLSAPAIPPEVQRFAAAKEIGQYLNAVIGLSHEAFPSSALRVSLGQDVEDETHQYIALDVAVGDQEANDLLARQHIWSTGMSRICPSRYAIYFVLGWR